IRLPSQRSDGIGFELESQRIRADLARDFLLLATIRYDQNIAAIGIVKSNVVDVRKFALRTNHVSASLDRLRKMSEGPILGAACELSSFGIESNQTTARERADIRASFFIEQQIPTYYALRPISQYPAKNVLPFRPIGSLDETHDIGPTFSPIGILRRQSILNLGHVIHAAHIPIPRAT